MASYTKCDRCGDSTERRPQLKFYLLQVLLKDDCNSGVVPTWEICEDCVGDLRRRWMDYVRAVR